MSVSLVNHSHRNTSLVDIQPRGNNRVLAQSEPTSRVDPVTVPSGSESETSSPEQFSESTTAYYSAEDLAERMFDSDSNMTDAPREDVAGPSKGKQLEVPELQGRLDLKSRELLEEFIARDQENKREINTLRAEIREIMFFIKDKSKNEAEAPIATQVNKPELPTTSVSSFGGVKPQKVVPIKWPQPYDHKDRSEWTTTHGILQYIYKRDVQAVTGTAKSKITGAFQSMLNDDRMTKPLELLKVMDDTFRDRNAEQNASTLLHACKQFRDEALCSFLPRFQQVLSRSIKSTSEDNHKIVDLYNALNQTTRNHLIGHDLPSSFLGFIEKLTVIGSQIEGVGLVKTRAYTLRQTGIFDDGTRGVAGGKLLGSNVRGNIQAPNFTYLSSSTPNTNEIMEAEDADGDTRMTGVNRTRAKWVSKKELDRRRVSGLCLRCGNHKHRIPACPQLPPLRPETAIKNSSRNRGDKRVAPEQSRVQGLKNGVCKVIAELQALDDQKAEKEMNGNPFLVDVLINNLFTVPALIDSGCDCLAAISNSLVRKADLPRIEVSPRKLTEATNSVQDGELITEMTKIELDINGYQRTLYAYIIPGLSHGLILGKPWMEREDVIYHTRERYMEIREAVIDGRPMQVWERQLNKKNAQVRNIWPNIMCLSAGVFLATIRRARKVNNEASQIFSATLADIQKALAPDKKTSTSMEKLPRQYYKFANLFKKEEIDKLPPHRPGRDHEIRLEPNKEIPWGPLYGMSRDELLVRRKTLTDLLDKNYIRASSSPAGAPVLFVRKPGGGLRFCVDYRALNSMSKADRYPLPLIKETLAKLRRAKWFTKLDVRAAFHKLRIKEGGEWKTAFRTRFGLFEWLVMPFGLSGAPASFQRYINETSREYLDEFCSAYVDDVLIYTNGNLVDHERHVNLVLEKLQKARLGLDIDKCEFSVKKTKYLGFIISAEGPASSIRMDPDKLSGFCKLLQGIHKRVFEHLCTFVSTYWKGFALEVGARAKQRVWNVKKKFISEPALAQWDPKRDAMLEADCSGYALGGCLLQKHERGLWMPVAYYSRKLSGAEMNYEIHDKELLAIVACMREWDAELRGLAKVFTITSDHMNLKYFLTTRRLTERQIRWAEFMSRFRYNLIYRKGSENERPDALSRRDQDKPKEGDPHLLARERQLLNPVKITKLRLGDFEVAEGSEVFTNEDLQTLWNQAIKEDSKYVQIIDAIQSQQRTWPRDLKVQTEGSSEPKPLKATIASTYFDQESWLLRYQGRIWVPMHEPLTTAIIQNIHDAAVSGHPGRDATLAQVSREYFWPWISKAVKRFCKNCHICGRSSIWRQQKQGLLQPQKMS
ncbi:hypothetical protein K3495_g10783 [Podosphaera aphanis]|nr:hypothetical protein K3495_g10783 [Podosphaera aphanis]